MHTEHQATFNIDSNIELLLCESQRLFAKYIGQYRLLLCESQRLFAKYIGQYRLLLCESQRLFAKYIGQYRLLLCDMPIPHEHKYKSFKLYAYSIFQVYLGIITRLGCYSLVTGPESLICYDKNNHHA